MTKIKILLLSLIAILFSTISCSKEESIVAQSTDSNTKKESLLLQKKYNFENINLNVDKSNVSIFKDSDNLKLTNKSNKLEELDLKKVTEINWKDNITSYFIPFANNPTKSIVIIVTSHNINDNNIDFSKGTIIENNVNQNTGTGDIIITAQEYTVQKTFVNGVLSQEITLSGRNKFRDCFDRAYDSICDGFIGCASWYSNPLPALTSVAYCGVTTMKLDVPDRPINELPITFHPEEPKVRFNP
ncbi:hypothetical protein QWY99_03570 [Flavobacterium branchiarum]|uniref:Lipoprotein n=1 Tax=Flavobacterium branchiarum TaxID=1114870 RepID=A0ABV5FN37_9FLAO|nr:hypothetical protein [Flavobacterium branchiarum]MDN3672147.1 hypothetical protein [Flavobacterium branchiarum]